MKDPFFATRMTRWANRAVALILLIVACTLPLLLNWYAGFRSLTTTEWWAIAIAYYLCLVAIFPALWSIEKLLKNVLSGQVFTCTNVHLLRCVRWCCGGVSLLCLPAGVIYLPLLFIVLIMAFLFLALSVMVQVMKAAVVIREENDLTI